MFFVSIGNPAWSALMCEIAAGGNRPLIIEIFTPAFSNGANGGALDDKWVRGLSVPWSTHEMPLPPSDRVHESRTNFGPSGSRDSSARTISSCRDRTNSDIVWRMDDMVVLVLGN